MLVLNDEIRELIVAREPIRRIKEAAKRNGTRFLREAALEMVRTGKRVYRRQIVSLLWRDRLQVFFAPGEVSVVRFPKGLRYEGLKFRGLKFKGLKFGSLKFGSLKFGSLKFGSLKPKPDATVSAVCEQKIGGAPWESPLEELERCLEGAGGTDVVITISNHFVRYSVLAPQKDIANPSELNSYAEFHMREVFGERAAGWVLSIGAWTLVTEVSARPLTVSCTTAWKSSPFAVR